jgi:HD superfamily phosphohydrolase YqeK
LNAYTIRMKQNEFDAIKSWFNHFIRKYDTKDELIITNLRYKEIHSFKVCCLCRLIAEDLKLSMEEIRLAEVIGLLHDTGRFPQFMKYRTFKDSISENHANLGVRILQEESVLKGLPAEEQQIILSAIQCHNCFILQPQNESIDLFSKIIRDADKLDIYRFILESEDNRLRGELKKTIYLELDEQPTFSETMLISILNNHCCLYSDLKSVHDFKLLQLSWVFDINFPITFKLLQANKYLPQIYSLLPREENIQLLIEHVNQYVASKANSQMLQKTSEELDSYF